MSHYEYLSSHQRTFKRLEEIFGVTFWFRLFQHTIEAVKVDRYFDVDRAQVVYISVTLNLLFFRMLPKNHA